MSQPSMEPDQSECRFELEDGVAWQEYLRTHGYVVIANVADPAEGRDLFWRFMEGRYRMSRDDPSTWFTDSWPAEPGTGIFFSDTGVCHTQFMWWARTRPKVKQAFASLWHTEDLLVSYDGAGVMRPWHRDGCEDAKTSGGWFHVDQNPHFKPDLTCIQGMVSMYDANVTMGGFSVIPYSHDELFQGPVKDSCPRSAGDFHVVPGRIINDARPSRLVPCRAGDLTLWDSRTLHCNEPAWTTPAAPDNELLRLVAYVCMLPTSRTSISVRKRRLLAYRQRVGSDHWPTETRYCLGPANTPEPNDGLDIGEEGMALVTGLEARELVLGA